MDQPGIKQPEPRRSKEQMRALLGQYETSQGMTVKAFCQLHKISQASFYAARKRNHTAAVKKKSSGFIPVAQPAPDHPVVTLFAEVKGVKLYQPVSAGYLKALITI